MGDIASHEVANGQVKVRIDPEERMLVVESGYVGPSLDPVTIGAPAT